MPVYHSLQASRRRDGENIQKYKNAQIKVGNQYQANIPACNIDVESAKLEDPRCVLYWKMSDKLQLNDLQKYIDETVKEHFIELDQALGLLYWHKYNIVNAKKTMSKIVQMDEKWSEKEEDLFRQAIEINGKDFRKIKEFLPDRSIGQLVHHFYKFKAKTAKKSWIDWIISKDEKNNSQYNEESKKIIAFSKNKIIKNNVSSFRGNITAEELDEALKISQDDHITRNNFDNEIIKLKNETQQQKQICINQQQEIEKLLQKIKKMVPHDEN